MSGLYLTRRAIDEISHPLNGQDFYRDTKLKGFGLRVGTQSKVYFAEGQVNGRTRRVTIARSDLLAPEKARQKAMSLLAEMANGQNPNEVKRKEALEHMTLENAFAHFFKSRQTLSPHTVSNYSRTINLYLKAWRKKPINKITRQMVRKKHEELSEQVGATTANGVMRHLRSIYNFSAASYEEFPPNPVHVLTQARAWHKEERRKNVINNENMPKWWSAVLQEPEYARDFLLVCLFTGMRRSEVMKLKWENINLHNKSLHLPKTKNGDPLDLPLSNFLFDLLSKRLESRQGSPYVFPSTGKTGHLVETKKFLQRVSNKSGVKFTLHDLRRTYITVAESLDIPYYALKRLLNHRISGDVTSGYIVTNVDRLRDPVERISQKILELVSVR